VRKKVGVGRGGKMEKDKELGKEVGKEEGLGRMLETNESLLFALAFVVPHKQKDRGISRSFCLCSLYLSRTPQRSD